MCRGVMLLTRPEGRDAGMSSKMKFNVAGMRARQATVSAACLYQSNP